MKSLSHRERVECTISGEKTDFAPISFWNHFPVDDQNSGNFASATVNFQNSFDFDFIKVSPASSFCIKDWGAVDEWRGNVEGTRDYLSPVITQPDDWAKLKTLDPHEGYLGAQLYALKLIKKEIPNHTPIIQTIFNPLSQAKNLVGKNNLFLHLRKYPEELHAGLRTITKTTTQFIEECQKIGIDGLFYAVQHASHDLLTEKEFISFVIGYDRGLFGVMKEFWLNLLHIHGSNIMYEYVTDYPMQVFNWHDRETSPNLKLGKEIFMKTVCGGLDRNETMVLGDKENIRSEINDALEQTDGKNHILGTGCVLPLNTPFGNIKSAVEFTRSKHLA